MKSYIIKHETVSSRGGKILKRGEIYPETFFLRANIPSLILNGFIAESDSAELIIEDEIQQTIVIDNSSLNNLPKWKKRLAIVTACWKRPEIFEMFAVATKKLKHPDLEIIVIVSGSEGIKSKQMVEKHGFIYIEIHNDPLATKMNATTIVANQLSCDYVLCVGSDDLITNELLCVYAEQINLQVDYVAVLDWYFYDTISKKMSYWGGYTDSRRIGHTCGAGRLISARLMNQWNWQPWQIKHSKVLDNSMQHKLTTTPHTSFIFSLKQFNLYAFDIKSNINMTPFELWENTSYIKDPNAEKILKQITCVE